MLSTIGERMAYIREVFSLSQEELATQLKMSRSNLSSLEINRTSPTLQTVCFFSLLFNTYVDWLVFGTGETPEPPFSISYEGTSYHPGFDTFFTEPMVKEYFRFLASNLKSFRKSHKLTQSTVVLLAHIAQPSYSKIEKAKSNFSIDVFERILIGLNKTSNISGDWLLFGIKQYQKGVIFPRDAFRMRNNEVLIDSLYDEMLDKIKSRKETNIHFIHEIRRTKLIPFDNLTDEQIQIVVNLIYQLEGKNGDAQ